MRLRYCGNFQSSSSLVLRIWTGRCAVIPPQFNIPNLYALFLCISNPEEASLSYNTSFWDAHFPQLCLRLRACIFNSYVFPP